MMNKGIKGYTRLSAVLALVAALIAVPVFADKYSIQSTVHHKAKVAVNQPVVLDKAVNGVKIETIYFSSELMATVIVQNQTPVTVYPELGLALFDKQGNLIATGRTETMKRGTIKANKQNDFTFRFRDFIDDFSKVGSYQLIMALKQKNEY